MRVKPAPKSPAGKTLGRADVPEEEWKKFGLAPPVPDFFPGVYDNSDLPLTDLEKEILELRSEDRSEERVGDAAKVVEAPDVSLEECPLPAFRYKLNNLTPTLWKWEYFKLGDKVDVPWQCGTDSYLEMSPAHQDHIAFDWHVLRELKSLGAIHCM